MASPHHIVIPPFQPPGPTLSSSQATESDTVSIGPSQAASSQHLSSYDLGSARDTIVAKSPLIPSAPPTPSNSIAPRKMSKEHQMGSEHQPSHQPSIEPPDSGMLSELAFSTRQPLYDRPPQAAYVSDIHSEAAVNLTPTQLAQVLVDKLVAAKGDRSQKNILIKEEDINVILGAVRDVFMSQPMLVEMNPPVKICGDIHGQFYDMLRLFDKCGFPSQTTPYLFLGDYVDRGKHSIETVILLFSYKILYPNAITLLRGNHECLEINRQYGFFDDVKRRYNMRLFKLFVSVFDTMPICCSLAGKIVCMHGGLSPDLSDLRIINTIKRPCNVPGSGIMCDLLWSDPAEVSDVSGFIPSRRGVGWEFGEDIVEKFLDLVDMDLIVRGHEVMDRGYGFFADRQLVTIFSAPGYCGEFDNDAAVMNVDEGLQCSFTVLSPWHRMGRR